MSGDSDSKLKPIAKVTAMAFAPATLTNPATATEALNPTTVTNPAATATNKATANLIREFKSHGDFEQLSKERRVRERELLSKEAKRALLEKRRRGVAKAKTKTNDLNTTASNLHVAIGHVSETNWEQWWIDNYKPTSGVDHRNALLYQLLLMIEDDQELVHVNEKFVKTGFYSCLWKEMCEIFRQPTRLQAPECRVHLSLLFRLLNRLLLNQALPTSTAVALSLTGLEDGIVFCWSRSECLQGLKPPNASTDILSEADYCTTLELVATTRLLVQRSAMFRERWAKTYLVPFCQCLIANNAIMYPTDPARSTTATPVSTAATKNETKGANESLVTTTTLEALEMHHECSMLYDDIFFEGLHFETLTDQQWQLCYRVSYVPLQWEAARAARYERTVVHDPVDRNSFEPQWDPELRPTVGMNPLQLVAGETCTESRKLQLANSLFLGRAMQDLLRLANAETPERVKLCHATHLTDIVIALMWISNFELKELGAAMLADMSFIWNPTTVNSLIQANGPFVRMVINAFGSHQHDMLAPGRSAATVKSQLAPWTPIYVSLLGTMRRLLNSWGASIWNTAVSTNSTGVVSPGVESYYAQFVMQILDYAMVIALKSSASELRLAAFALMASVYTYNSKKFDIQSPLWNKHLGDAIHRGICDVDTNIVYAALKWTNVVLRDLNTRSKTRLDNLLELLELRRVNELVCLLCTHQNPEISEMAEAVGEFCFESDDESESQESDQENETTSVKQNSVDLAPTQLSQPLQRSQRSQPASFSFAISSLS